MGRKKWNQYEDRIWYTFHLRYNSGIQMLIPEMPSLVSNDKCVCLQHALVV